MGVYVHESNWASKRGLVFIGVVGIHILLIWGLSNGFAMKIVESIAPPIVTDLIEEKKDEEAPPPPPPPKMEMPPVEVPPPVVDISIPVETNTTALSNVTDKPQPPAPPPPVAAAPVARTPIRQNPRSQQPNMDDYYPAASKRLGEEGVAKVKVCVNVQGRVEDASLDETSGTPRLDEAAVKVARAYRLLPPTENGKAVPGCGSLPIRFKLTGG
jgi:periplasmic protein TonB